MKRRQVLQTALAGAGAAGVATVARAQTPIEWKMVTSWPKNTPGVGVNAQRLADLIEQLSGGRLRIRLFAAGELVPPFEVIDAVQRGTAEIGHTALYYGVGKSAALHFFTTIPFGLNMNELGAWLAFGEGGALKDEVMAQFGVHGFYTGSSGVQALGWFREEIESLDDIRGLKIRIAGLGGAALERLGATPVTLPPGDIFQALQSGTVDAAEWVGPWNDLAFGLHKVARYYYLPAFHEPGPALDAVVNREAFAALPEDLQAIVRAACDAIAHQTNSDFLYHNIDAFQRLGSEFEVEVRSLPEAVIPELGQATREVLEQIMADDDLAHRVGESYLAFLRRATVYASAMEEKMLAQRARVWA